MWSFHLRTTLSNNSRTHNNNSFKLKEIALMRQVPQIIKSNKINRQLNWVPNPNSAKTEEKSQTIGRKTSKNLSGIILSSSNMRLAAIWELRRTTNKIRIIREVVCLENMIKGGRQLLTILIL